MGSEHLINRKRFPLEVHLVHRNLKYNSVTEALSKSDGLAVVGFFFEVDHGRGTGKAWLEGVKPQPAMSNVKELSLDDLTVNAKKNLLCRNSFHHSLMLKLLKLS